MPDYDVAVIGAGHNALITAAYAAKAGYRVGVFERRGIAGGAVATQELIPGYRFDLGGSAHILIRLTPIVEELELASYGLEYLDLDPLFFAPFEDGDTVFFYRDAERTAAGIEREFPGEGEAYLRFLEEWRPFAQAMREAFLAVPSPLELGKRVLFRSGLRKDFRRALSLIIKPYGEVVEHYFREDKVKAPLLWMAAQSGPPPGEPFTGPFLLWHPLYHQGGVARPRGGSGALTQALQRLIESRGGAVHLGRPVERILIERGRAVGLVAQGQDCTARAVVAGAHALETYGRLLPPEHRPPLAQGMRAGNGFGFMVRLALSRPVAYRAHPGREARVGLQLICRDRAQIDAAYGDFLRGEPATDPPIVAMTFSAVDDTLAPPGAEVLWLWGQYYPYQLSRGRSWEDLADEAADGLIAAFEIHAPGTRDAIVGRLVQSPLWLERELGLRRGNVMHLEMSLDQMFALRPFLGAGGYRTHLKGLYLTGASTHPGGGIMGAAGRNCARVLLRDLGGSRF